MSSTLASNCPFFVLLILLDVVGKKVNQRVKAPTSSDSYYFIAGTRAPKMAIDYFLFDNIFFQHKQVFTYHAVVDITRSVLNSVRFNLEKKMHFYQKKISTPNLLHRPHLHKTGELFSGKNKILVCDRAHTPQGHLQYSLHDKEHCLRMYKCHTAQCIQRTHSDSRRHMSAIQHSPHVSHVRDLRTIISKRC